VGDHQSGYTTKLRGKKKSQPTTFRNCLEKGLESWKVVLMSSRGTRNTKGKQNHPIRQCTLIEAHISKHNHNRQVHAYSVQQPSTAT
jgi:hypothetical protein